MSEERSGADISAKIAGQEFNVKNVKSLNTALTMGCLLIGVGVAVLLWTHVEGADKTVTAIREGNAALLKEIKDSNKAQLDAQKNIAFHNCRQSCLLEQRPDKRDGSACERICASLRP